MNRQQFDIKAALPQAWDLVWKDQVRQQQEGAEFSGKGAHYVTASDLESQVRRFANEQHEGKAWGSTGRAWGREYAGVRIRTGSRITLLDVCRGWLQSQRNAGKLEEFNFGRGHISGARYRPAGIGLSDAEKQTMQRRENPTPYAERRVHAGGRPLCTWKPGWYYRGSRGRVRHTDKPGEVTCPACRNLLAKPLSREETTTLKDLQAHLDLWDKQRRAGKPATETAVKRYREMRALHAPLAKRLNAQKWKKEHK